MSESLAAFLRIQRQRCKLSLRDVEDRTRQWGAPIPFTTLGKVERGLTDPGVRRLNQLCKIYGVPLQVAGDILDLEDGRGKIDAANQTVDVLLGEATAAWKQGDLSVAVATLAALRRRSSESEIERQKGLLHFAIVAGSLGKYHLSHAVVDELLLAPPVEELFVSIMVQAAVCWHRRGNGEAALGFLGRAALALPEGNAGQRAYVRHETASVLTTMGQLDEAEDEIVEAISAYSDAGNRYGQGGAMAVRIRIALAKGCRELALERAEEALQHSRHYELDRLVCLRSIDKANVLIALDRLDEAIVCLNEALAAALVKNDEPAQFFIYHSRWRARLAQDDPERAALELGAAQYAVRHVDESCPEAKEVRHTMGHDHGETDLL